MTQRPTAILCYALLLLLLIAAVHIRGLGAPFIYDDRYSIVDNPHLQQLWPLSEALTARPQATNAGRPLVSLTLALNYAVGGLDPWGYHLFNLALHVGCALLLLGVVRRALDSPLLADRFAQRSLPLAAALALLWAIHPLQTEPVTYVMQRTELLMSLCLLATLYAAQRHFQETAPRPRILWLLLAAAACLLGMTAKENMAAAPLLVLLLDRALYSGSLAAALRRRRPLYLLLACSYLLLAALMLTAPRSQSVGFGLGISAWDYLKTQAGILLWYLRLVFWPHPLSVTYNWPLATELRQWLVPGLVILLLLGLTVWSLIRRPAVGLIAAAFFLILAPTSSFIPITTEFAAERRMYLPLAAVLLLLMLAADALLRRLPARRRPLAAGVLLLGLAALWGGLSTDRLLDYQSDLTLWQVETEHQPQSYTAHNELGNALIRRGEYEQAASHFQQALAIHPRSSPALANLAGILLLKGQVPQAQELSRQALELDPRNASAAVNLGMALARQGHLEQAAQAWTQALEISPLHPQAHFHLGKLLIQQNQAAPALTHFQSVLAVRPDDASAHDYCGVALAMLGRKDEARRHFATALKLDPQHRAATRHLQMLAGDSAGGKTAAPAAPAQQDSGPKSQ